MKILKLTITFIILIIAGTSFFSCDENSYGTLAIRLPGESSSRAIIPVPSDVTNKIKQYSIICSGPGNISQVAKPGELIYIPLPSGKWDIAIKAFDNKNQRGNPIGTGEKKGVTIAVGRTTPVTISITIDAAQFNTNSNSTWPYNKETAVHNDVRGLYDFPDPPENSTLIYKFDYNEKIQNETIFDIPYRMAVLKDISPEDYTVFTDYIDSFKFNFLNNTETFIDTKNRNNKENLPRIIKEDKNGYSYREVIYFNRNHYYKLQISYEDGYLTIAHIRMKKL